ncbi:MAG: QueT transporter family protein [Oscillospiraceae bacterium]|nr:QueT transporter family protein [Oscillospiraceae bacterium]
MKAQQLTLCGMVAAAYVILTLITSAFGLAYGPIQFRISEALCMLPFYFPMTTWGLFIGCLVSNLLSPYGAIDMIVGSIATLLACLWTTRLRRKVVAPLPMAIVNGVLVGAMIALSESSDPAVFLPAFLWNACTVAAGELVVGYVLGLPLLHFLPRSAFFRPRIMQNRP